MSFCPKRKKGPFYRGFFNVFWDIGNVPKCPNVPNAWDIWDTQDL